MRIENVSVPAAEKTGSAEAPRGLTAELRPGDPLEARVLSSADGRLELRLADGSRLTARFEGDLPPPAGRTVALQVASVQAGLIRLVLDGGPDTLTLQRPLPVSAAPAPEAAAWAAQLELQGLPATPEALARMARLLGQEPRLPLARAAFLAGNPRLAQAGPPEAAARLLAGEDPAGQQLGLLSQALWARSGRPASPAGGAENGAAGAPLGESPAGPGDGEGKSPAGEMPGGGKSLTAGAPAERGPAAAQAAGPGSFGAPQASAGTGGAPGDGPAPAALEGGPGPAASAPSQAPPLAPAPAETAGAPQALPPGAGRLAEDPAPGSLGKMPQAPGGGPAPAALEGGPAPAASAPAQALPTAHAPAETAGPTDSQQPPLPEVWAGLLTGALEAGLSAGRTPPPAAAPTAGSLAQAAETAARHLAELLDLPESAQAEGLARFVDDLFVRIDGWQADSPALLQKAREELYLRLSLLRAGLARSALPDRPQLARQAEGLMEHLDLLGRIEQFTYAQIPIQQGGEAGTAELYIYRDKKRGRRIDPENARILLALDLPHLGRLQIFAAITGRDVALSLEVADPRWVEALRGQTAGLYAALSESGYRLTENRVRAADRPVTAESAMAALARFEPRPSGLDIRL